MYVTMLPVTLTLNVCINTVNKGKYITQLRHIQGTNFNTHLNIFF